MATNSSSGNCELKEALTSAHSEFISGIKEKQVALAECHKRQEWNKEVDEQRRLATEDYRRKRENANSSLMDTLHKLMEGQDARRKSIMAAAASQPDCQDIIDELQLHHAKVQNIITGSLMSPQSETKSLGLSSNT